MARAYLEGRCVECGQRVTVDREPPAHTRLGRWCGPVYTEHPSTAPDEPFGDQWMIPRADGSLP